MNGCLALLELGKVFSQEDLLEKEHFVAGFLLFLIQEMHSSEGESQRFVAGFLLLLELARVFFSGKHAKRSILFRFYLESRNRAAKL